MKSGDSGPSPRLGCYGPGDTGKHFSPVLGLRVLPCKRWGIGTIPASWGSLGMAWGDAEEKGFGNHTGLSGIGINVRLVLASVNRTAHSNAI